MPTDYCSKQCETCHPKHLMTAANPKESKNLGVVTPQPPRLTPIHNKTMLEPNGHPALAEKKGRRVRVTGRYAMNFFNPILL